MLMTSRQGPHCPHCPHGKNHKGEPVGYQLFKGADTEEFYCYRCGHAFFITYKIDKIEYAGEEYDIGTWKERRDEEATEEKRKLEAKLQEARDLLAVHGRAVP